MYFSKHIADSISGSVPDGFFFDAICGKGSETIAYRVHDCNGKLFALKMPADNIDQDAWFAKQIQAVNNRNQFCYGYKGDVFVPQCVQLEKGYSLEEFASGEPLTYELYQALSQDDKAFLSKQLADFIANAHRQTFNSQHKRIDVDNAKINLDEGIHFLLEKHAISEKEASVYLRLATKFSERDSDDEIMCLVHRDICEENLLYDHRLKRLSVIDFSSSRMGCVYEDFIPAFNHLSLSTPYLFFADVIQHYNSMFGCVMIQQEKVTTHHYLSAINEVAVIALCQKLNDRDVAHLVGTLLFPLLNRITEALSASGNQGV